jgi:hypothetical protein
MGSQRTGHYGSFLLHQDARQPFTDGPTLAETAEQITIPIEFVLQWDDEHIPRQSGLALFDAFASKEKTLHANAAGTKAPLRTGRSCVDRTPFDAARNARARVTPPLDSGSP